MISLKPLAHAKNQLLASSLIIIAQSVPDTLPNIYSLIVYKICFMYLQRGPCARRQSVLCPSDVYISPAFFKKKYLIFSSVFKKL